MSFAISSFAFITDMNIQHEIILELLVVAVHPVSVDLRVNRISAISGHMHRLEGRRMRRGASGTPACACLPNDAYAQRWRLIGQTLIYLQPLLFASREYKSKQKAMFG